MGKMLANVSRHLALAVMLAASPLGAAPRAQEAVTAADVQGLRDAVFEAGTDLARLRTGDAVLLEALRADLDAIRDRIAGLESTLRTPSVASRGEFIKVREQIVDVRRRARGELTVTGAGLGPGSSAPDPASVPAVPLGIPRRTTVDVQLLTALDPALMRVDDRVEAATLKPILVKKEMVLPAGSLVRGVVASIRQGHGGRVPKALTVRFNETIVGFRAQGIDATVEIGRPLQPGAVVRARFN